MGSARMKILGISGKRESGKSSLGKFLTAYGFNRVSLATPLKEACKRDYGLTDDQVYGVFKEQPTQYKRTDGSFYTPRDILIREGCLKRSIDPLYWCKNLHFLMKTAYYTDSFIIDDIRFINEVEYFKKLGAKFIRLERSQEAIGKAALDDLSECDLDNYKDWDFRLIKELNRNLNDLKQFAEYIVAHL